MTLIELTDNQAAVLKTGRVMLAKYSPAPSAEEFDETRKDMFYGFGENF